MTFLEQLRRRCPAPAPPGRPPARSSPDDDVSQPAPAGRPDAAAAAPEAAGTTQDITRARRRTPSSRYNEAVPDGLHVAAAWGWRVIVVAIMVIGIAYVLVYLSEVTIPLLVAILLTALLLPVTKRLHAWGVNRGLATAITVLGGIAVIAGVLYLIVSSIVSQSSTLGTNVTTGFNQLATWLQNGPLHVSATYFNPSEWVTRITNWVKSQPGARSPRTRPRSARRSGTSWPGWRSTLFSLFYFLHNGREIFDFLLKFFPRKSRAPRRQAPPSTAGTRSRPTSGRPSSSPSPTGSACSSPP